MWCRFMAFLATVIFIAAGCLLLLVPEGYFVTSEDVLSFIDGVYNNFGTRFVVISTGMGLLILGLFNVYVFLLRLRRKSFVTIRGPAGDIQISHRTIEELVEKVRRDLGGIDKISTRIIPRRRKISLEIKLFLGSVRNVIDISRRVQERVKEDVENILGITNLGKIKLSIKRIALEKEKRYEDILEEKKSSRGIELQR